MSKVRVSCNQTFNFGANLCNNRLKNINGIKNNNNNNHLLLYLNTAFKNQSFCSFSVVCKQQ